MQDDNPASSPWGNSPAASPRQSNTAFGSVLGPEPSPPPFKYNSGSNGLSQDQEGGFGSQEAYRRPDTASSAAETEAGTEGSGPEETRQRANAPFGDEHEAPETPQKPHDAGDASHFGGSGQPEGRAQQPHHPQFKLMAKVTGLERTGKKDPILRFDVHVSVLQEGVQYNV